MEHENFLMNTQSDPMKAKYKALFFPDHTLEDLKAFFQAVADFYHIIPLQKAHALYNTLYAPMTWASFASFAEVAREDMVHYGIQGAHSHGEEALTCALEDMEIIHECELQFEGDYETLKETIQDLPYFMPTKEQLFEDVSRNGMKTAAYDALVAFMDDVFKHARSNYKGKSFVSDILIGIEGNDPLEKVLRHLSFRGGKFQSVTQAMKLCQLVEDMAQDVRMYALRGHTPREMRAQGVDVCLLAGKETVSDYVVEHDLLLKGGTYKVGRNEPCPCASGRKFKQCCGR